MYKTSVRDLNKNKWTRGILLKALRFARINKKSDSFRTKVLVPESRQNKLNYDTRNLTIQAEDQLGIWWQTTALRTREEPVYGAAGPDTQRATLRIEAADCVIAENPLTFRTNGSAKTLPRQWLESRLFLTLSRPPNNGSFTQGRRVIRPVTVMSRACGVKTEIYDSKKQRCGMLQYKAVINTSHNCVLNFMFIFCTRGEFTSTVLAMLARLTFWKTEE